MKINFKARQLVRSAHRGYLSTEFDSKNFKNIKTQMNTPFSYSTFTLTAFDYDLSPILLLSDLSEHTKNVQEKNSASLSLSSFTLSLPNLMYPLRSFVSKTTKKNWSNFFFYQMLE